MHYDCAALALASGAATAAELQSSHQVCAECCCLPFACLCQILEHVAAVLGKDSAEVKAANFLPEVHTAKRPIAGSSSGSSSSDGGGGGGSRLSDSSISSSTTQGQLSSAGSDTSSSGSEAAISWSPECSLQEQEPLALQQQLLARALKEAPEASRDHDCLDQPGSSSQLELSQPAAAGVVTALGRFIAAESYTLPRLWRELLQTSRYSERVKAVQQHNSSHAWSKRGIVVTPVRCDCRQVHCSGIVCVCHGATGLVATEGSKLYPGPRPPSAVTSMQARANTGNCRLQQGKHSVTGAAVFYPQMPLYSQMPLSDCARQFDQ